MIFKLINTPRSLATNARNGFIGMAASISLGLVLVPPVQATTTAEQARSAGIWTVESGQWLGRIVAALEPNPAKRARLMEEIVFLNPQAFVNADPNRMLAGAQLRLPDGSSGADSAPVAAADKPVAVTEPVAVSDRIGRVTSMRGKLTATGSDGTSRQLRRRSYIRQGDTLNTSEKGGAQVRFNDGAQIALRRDSSLTIDEYNWQGSEDGQEKAVLSLVKGGFRTITGAIGRVNKANYRVNSPFATIGIRGTHYALMACQGGSCAALPGGGSDDGLFGGTAFGRIAVDDTHEVGPQQYFRHDGQSFQTLMGPPPFLFAPDTQIGDDGEGDTPGPLAGDGSGDEGGSDSFSSDGGTETGGLIAGLPVALPGQEDDSLFAEGEEVAAAESEGGAFDPNFVNLQGDLSGVGAGLTQFFADLGIANVVLHDSAPGDVAYGAAVVSELGLFDAGDEEISPGFGNDFFITGDANGSGFDALIGSLSSDTENGFFEASLFFGPPGGNLIAQKTVMKPAFSGYLGRWDAGATHLFYEEQFDELGQDFPLATEFVWSPNRTPDAQLANLSGLGSFVNFQSLHGFGSDEQGQGFEIFAGDIQFDVNFVSMTIEQASIGISDAQGRFWSLFGSSLGVSLENDAHLVIQGGCSGCGGGSASAEGFIYATFLGANAEGVLGSFGGHAHPSLPGLGLLDQDVPFAIGGVYIGERFLP